MAWCLPLGSVPILGKSAKDGGIYAQIKGDSSVKVADPEGLDALNKGQSDMIEPPPGVPAKSAK